MEWETASERRDSRFANLLAFPVGAIQLIVYLNSPKPW